MKIMISAGEVSGDVHGSYLIREIKKLAPAVSFFGMGSELLRAEGVEINFDISQRGTIGVFEALPNLIPIYLTYRKMIGLMKKERPDLLLLIDSQGINMPLAAAAKKLGIKTAYYIAPQEWLWGTERGVKKVAKTIDLIIAVFEKEYQSYKQAGGNVVYFGHPLLDIVRPSMPKEEIQKSFLGSVGRDRSPSSLVVSLCPGSRAQEIGGLFPILLATGKLIRKTFPDARFLIPVASTNMIKEIFAVVGDFPAKAIVGQTYNILSASDLAICTSGTINLEASILGVPNIMVYKLSPFTYWLGKYVLRIGEKLPYFSMPNLLANEKVIPELVMEEANPQNIANEAISLLQNPDRRENMSKGFISIRKKLGSEGVIQKVAEAITQHFLSS